MRMKRPYAGDTRVVDRHELVGIDVGLVDVHRTKFVDLDQLVVEAVALLLEQHRALSSLMAMAMIAMMGSAHKRASDPTILSNSHFITTSQSAIGLSNMSSTATLPM